MIFGGNILSIKDYEDVAVKIENGEINYEDIIAMINAD